MEASQVYVFLVGGGGKGGKGYASNAGYDPDQDATRWNGYGGGGANHMTTGWIPYTYSNEKDANGEYKNAIYVKNLKLDTSDDHCRIYCYETKAATPPGGSAPGYTKGTTMGNHFTMTDLSSNGTYYYKFTPTKALYNSIKYVRLSLVYKDSNGEFGKPIITFGEPIE